MRSHIWEKAMSISLNALFFSFAGVGVLAVTGCAPNAPVCTSEADTSCGGVPVPAITFLSPAGRIVGSPSFTLTVNGSDFIELSQVYWNGSPRTTTFVSATQLTAVIGPGDISSQGSAKVTVVNSSYTENLTITSNAVPFTITLNAPPVIQSIGPEHAASARPAFSLQVNGARFDPSSVVFMVEGSASGVFFEQAALAGMGHLRNMI